MVEGMVGGSNGGGRMRGEKRAGGREGERDREVENVNYINILLRRERLTNSYSTTDTT